MSASVRIAITAAPSKPSEAGERLEAMAAAERPVKAAPARKMPEVTETP